MKYITVGIFALFLMSCGKWTSDESAISSENAQTSGRTRGDVFETMMLERSQNPPTGDEDLSSGESENVENSPIVDPQAQQRKELAKAVMGSGKDPNVAKQAGASNVNATDARTVNGLIGVLSFAAMTADKSLTSTTASAALDAFITNHAGDFAKVLSNVSADAKAGALAIANDVKATGGVYETIQSTATTNAVDMTAINPEIDNAITSITALANAM